ncbi:MULTISPECIES: hypothetical protein, partial [Bradyrhizobium]|uniref:hypothetical protein n=1 Tax=Bradyrhizobium TaxID=374 RepID=UPI001EDBD027
SSISSFGRRLSNAHIAESKSLKNSGQNTFCQSSANTTFQLASSSVIFTTQRKARRRGQRASSDLGL